MAYRKTEKVLAQLEARRASIIASAIDVISRSGMDGLTTDAVAERAGISEGLIYKYFPDKTEMVAATVAHLLARDLAAMKEAIGTARGAQALEKGILCFLQRMASNYRLMSAVSLVPAYREGIKRELARLIRGTGTSEPLFILVCVAAGALFEAGGSLRPRDGVALTTALLRAIGVRRTSVPLN